MKDSTVAMTRTPKGDLIVTDAPDFIDVSLRDIEASSNGIVIETELGVFPNVIGQLVIFGTVKNFKATYRVIGWSMKRLTLKCEKVS